MTENIYRNFTLNNSLAAISAVPLENQTLATDGKNCIIHQIDTCGRDMGCKTTLRPLRRLRNYSFDCTFTALGCCNDKTLYFLDSNLTEAGAVRLDTRGLLNCRSFSGYYSHHSCGCNNGCNGGCNSGCNGGCNNGCNNGCNGGCNNGCNGGCNSGCNGGCSNGCNGGCNGGCNSGCNSGCNNGCGNGCNSGNNKRNGGCSSGSGGICNNGGSCNNNFSMLCTWDCGLGSEPFSELTDASLTQIGNETYIVGVFPKGAYLFDLNGNLAEQLCKTDGSEILTDFIHLQNGIFAMSTICGNLRTVTVYNNGNTQSSILDRCHSLRMLIAHNGEIYGLFGQNYIYNRIMKIYSGGFNLPRA